MFKHKEWFQRIFYPCLVAMILTGLAAPAGAFGPALCQDAIWVDPGALWSGYGGGREILAFDVTSKGILGLQATAPATSDAEPQLVALGRDCTGDIRGATILRRFLSGYVLRVEEPGIYYFFVRSQNPGEPLDEVQVTSRFMSWQGFGPIRAKDITEGEDDPDPLVPSSYCEVEDDHAGTFDCATDLTLGEPMPGVLQLRDVDTFSFRLDDQATIRLESRSDIDLIGSLYNENGHRLAVDDDSGSDEDFQITKTLAAGRYFVTVEGHGRAEGPYTLTGEHVDW